MRRVEETIAMTAIRPFIQVPSKFALMKSTMTVMVIQTVMIPHVLMIWCALSETTVSTYWLKVCQLAMDFIGLTLMLGALVNHSRHTVI